MRDSSQIATALREKADNLIGLVMAFVTATSQLTTEELDRFLDVVPEKGDALWDRFIEWRDHPDTPPKSGFVEFIRVVIAPKPTQLKLPDS